MFCQNCGKENKSNAKFCISCGQKHIKVSSKKIKAHKKIIKNIIDNKKRFISISFLKQSLGFNNNTDASAYKNYIETYFYASLINLICIFLLTIILAILIWLPGFLVLITPLYVSLGVLTWSPFILALLPLIFSILAEKQLSFGKIEKAKNMSKKAKFFIFVSIIQFIAVVIIKLILFWVIAKTTSAIWERVFVFDILKDLLPF